MVALSSSACPPMPMRLSAWSAFSRADGSGIATLGSLRKPLLAPSCATATSIPFDRAARNPPAASLELSASTPAAPAREPPSAVQASSVSCHDRCREDARIVSGPTAAALIKRGRQCRLPRRQSLSARRANDRRRGELRQHHRARARLAAGGGRPPPPPQDPSRGGNAPARFSAAAFPLTSAAP